MGRVCCEQKQLMGDVTRFTFLFCVSRRGIHGMFPLHLAVLYGFSDCCRKLLSSGSDSFHRCVINTPTSACVCVFMGSSSSSRSAV